MNMWSRIALFAIISLTCSTAGGQGALGNLVLVTGINSDVRPLSSTELRRLFLGFPVYHDDSRLVPVLMMEDKLLFEVFLQKTMFMSAVKYEKQLVRRVFQFGGTRPAQVDDMNDMVDMLERRDNSIAFMWEDQARRIPSLKVVQVLWQGKQE